MPAHAAHCLFVAQGVEDWCDARLWDKLLIGHPDCRVMSVRGQQARRWLLGIR